MSRRSREWSSDLSALRRPKSGEQVDIVLATWYMPLSVKSIAAGYASSSADVYAAAVPSRYGEYEPLKRSFEPTRVGDFEAARVGADIALLFDSAYPVLGGRMSGGGNLLGSPVHNVTVEMVADAAFSTSEDSRRIQHWFSLAAFRMDAFYADMQRVRGLIWGRGGGHWTRGADQPATPIYREDWVGLAGAQWCTYLSTQLVHANGLVSAGFDSGTVMRVDGGVLHRWSDLPIRSSEIDAPLISQANLRWITQDLLRGLGLIRRL